MLLSLLLAGTMHHRCPLFLVSSSGSGGFPIFSVTRDNIDDQRHMQIRHCLSLVHLYDTPASPLSLADRRSRLVGLKYPET